MHQSFIENLNDPQKEAVLHTEGPLLVLAGAGTGKTKVLTSRIAHIIEQGLASPYQIMAMTFTNKAAREMRERVAGLLGHDVGNLWIGTFHSISARILRRHAELVGRTSYFTIIDTDDQVRLLQQLLESYGLDNSKKMAKQCAYHIQLWKDKGYTPSTLPTSVTQNFDLTSGSRLYQDYQDRLLSMNAVDFGDLLLLTLKIMMEHKEVLEELQSQFHYFMVDEYQDTNSLQYLWMQRLTRKTNGDSANKPVNICCVGDDDQSIYSWRGAEVENILRFEQDFPGTKTIRLEENYRSTPVILQAASGLIQHNDKRMKKTLWTQQSCGDPIRLEKCWDGRDEARYVSDQIESFCRDEDVPYKQVAILLRAGFQTREFEERFMHIGLPYQVVGSLRFYERLEIKDILAYLRLIQDHRDDLAFERIINVPKRGIGKTTLSKIHDYARGARLSLFDAGQALMDKGEIKGATAKKLSDFMQDIISWQKQVRRPHREPQGKVGDASDGMSSMKTVSPDGVYDDIDNMNYDNSLDLSKSSPSQTSFLNNQNNHENHDINIKYLNPSELAESILDVSGYMAMLKQDNSDQAAGRIENLKEFISALNEFEELHQFLEHVSLVMDKNDQAEDDMVQLITIHSAKGLEFDYVFLPGWEEGIFPHQKSLSETGNKALEEERRLAYVALTRARKALWISFAQNRKMYNYWQQNMPSRFIKEIPKECFDSKQYDAFSVEYSYEHLDGASAGSFIHARSEMRQSGSGGGYGMNHSYGSGSRSSNSGRSSNNGWQKGRHSFARKKANASQQDVVYDHEYDMNQDVDYGSFNQKKSSKKHYQSNNRSHSLTQSGGGDHDDFQKGDWVFHKMYGKGMVVQNHGQSSDVRFNKGSKRIMNRFLKR